MRLVYVGRLSPRKGVDVAVSAAVLLRERGLPVHLTLVGAVYPGYEWYETQLREQVASSDARDAVDFVGFRTIVWPSLADADIALVPSRVDEPFGNTAVEAVLAGRPVVVSATSGLLEAAAGYGSVRIVTPDDAAAVADAVQDLVRSWSDLPLDADRAIARDRHAPQAYQLAMVDLVDDLVSDR